jgi:hypothetical protein
LCGVTDLIAFRSGTERVEVVFFAGVVHFVRFDFVLFILVVV